MTKVSRRVILMGTPRGPVVRVADITNPVLRVRGLRGSLDLLIWRKGGKIPMLYPITEDGDIDINSLSDNFSNPEALQVETVRGKCPMCDVISRAA